MRKKISFLAVLVLYSCLNAFAEPTWKNTWSEKVFEDAKVENKFVILDLEAIWCHWCHVMKSTTYADPQIQKVLEEHYIPIRIDQDSRPDLANKYKNYGWPATIVFNSKGEEIVKRSGYISPDDMKLLLEKIVQDPSPEEPPLDFSKIKFSNKPYLSGELKSQLLKMHRDSFDENLGGLKLAQKFLDRDSVEYSLSKINDSKEKNMAVKTLNAALKLIDPAWGGVYQYSTMSGWDYPHFEKLATIQGEYLRIYSLAYKTTSDEKYLKAAFDIHKYINDFLKDKDGAFYTSQDADLIEGEHGGEYYKLNDEGRRKLGIPRVDKHIYSSQNGIIISALADLFIASSDTDYLDESEKAARWIVKNRAIKPSLEITLKWIFSDMDVFFERIKWMLANQAWVERGFHHGENDPAGPFLNDTLNMGKAFLALYEATDDYRWFVKAEQAARFIKRNFEAPIAGFATSKSSCEMCAVRNPDILTEENIEIVRLASKLYKKTKNEEYKFIAEHAMKYLATSEIATRSIVESGVLIADEELKSALDVIPVPAFARINSSGYPELKQDLDSRSSRE